MVNININNLRIQIPEGATILEAAKIAGIHIPTLCHMKELSPTGACRICVVEVENQKNLLPACAFPVFEGMVVSTNSNRVQITRKTIVELLIENHPQDCLICVRNGNCELQSLAQAYGVREHRYQGVSQQHAIDSSSASLERDPAKCILCGRCVRVCHEIQKIGAIDFSKRGFDSIVTTPFNDGINLSGCILCGQCILVCPTAAIREKSSIKDVTEALCSKNKFTIVQVAPAVRATIGEAYGMAIGSDVTGKLVTALRRLGFDKVFDTNFSADLTIMEEATELIERIKIGNKIPMFTSCCPGWIKFAEQNYPEILPYISTCKSPHEMQGAIIKTFYAQKMGILPENIYVVSIMPCTVKKYEANRNELRENSMKDVDAVLTTRELVRLFDVNGIDFANIPDSDFDNPLGESTGAAVIFGTSGGVMEAALRTAHWKLTGENLEHLELEEIRGSEGIKKTTIKIADREINVAAVNGIGNVSALIDDVLNGKSKYHFIEVMTCPSGCINGGGQPIHSNLEKVKGRINALYQIDTSLLKRMSHENTSVKEIYEEFLYEPCSEIAHEILHTKYYRKE